MWGPSTTRVLAGNLVVLDPPRGTGPLRAHITPTPARLPAGGARLVFMPVAPNAYPSVRGFPNPPGDARLVQLAKLLRSYVRQHSERASLIDLPTILCPNGGTCPGEIAPGIRPRNLDGFHFDGDGAVWLAEQIMGMLLGTTRPPTSPEPPVCAEASLGTGLLTTRGGKCA